MKLAYAATALAFSGVVAADTCTSSQQMSAYTTLASLLTLSSFQGCVDDSGYSLLYSTSLPTDDQYVKMCASSNCQSLISSILSLNPPDCTLKVPTSGLELNVHELASGFGDKCKSQSTPSTTAPPATTAPPTSDTPVTTLPATDAPVTNAPVTSAPPASC